MKIRGNRGREGGERRMKGGGGKVGVRREEGIFCRRMWGRSGGMKEEDGNKGRKGLRGGI